MWLQPPVESHDCILPRLTSLYKMERFQSFLKFACYIGVTRFSFIAERQTIKGAKIHLFVLIMERSVWLQVLAIILVLRTGAVSARTFTMVNRCGYTVWPAILPSSGKTLLGNGGFSLTPGAWYSLQAPYGWSGRFWPRTGCNFDATGRGSCATGDCGNKLQCNGIGGQPPASLLEITLDGASGLDFYDVSLVDGFNIPVSLCPKGGSGSCKVAGCTNNLNTNCPGELQMKSNGQIVACKSACLAFNSPQYCCTGGYANTCAATRYSQVFKAACPAAYSFAKDDPSSLYTCRSASDYTMTFCPSQLGC